MVRRQRVVAQLREQGRGVMGALIFGTPFLFTMETWWNGWMLPPAYLLVYTIAGLAIVLVLTAVVGFRSDEEHRLPGPRRLALDFAELVLQSFLAAFIVLYAFGIIEIGDPLILVARLGLIQLVPLGFGAALANRLLGGDEKNGTGELPFPKDLAVFAAGALFFIFPIAPTQEMELMAAHAGPGRLLVVMGVSIIMTYLILYELEFQGQAGRLAGMSTRLRWGETFLVYATALVTAFVALAAFGHFGAGPPGVWAQLTIVLAFPAAIGGSAARVVL